MYNYSFVEFITIILLDLFKYFINNYIFLKFYLNMKYWLLKSEPDVWSIDQQIKTGRKGANWDGVRNYQAANNLKKMEKGDLCFFYHSNIGKEIVGIVEVIKTAFIDPTDKEKRFVAVKVKYKSKLKTPVSLENIKKIKI